MTGRVFKNYVAPHQAQFIMRNWVWMAALVLAAEPAILQAAVWAMFPTGPDDEPWTWDNEADRKFYADVTPAIRAVNPSYQGAPTGSRRVYLRWGKQAYEITDGWLADPQNQFLRKLSQPARLALEMATGKSPGSEWSLGFNNLGLRGLLEDRDGEFAGSRLGLLFQKFMPFSILQWAGQPDARPAGLLGTTSKGMSYGAATAAYEGLIRAYALDETWEKLRQSPRMRHNLEALGPELLAAVKRNGYDPAKVISAARGVVLKELYGRAYEAINEGNENKLHRVGLQILRLNGTVQTLTKSVQSRNQQYGKEPVLTPEQKAMLDEAFALK